MPTQSPMDRRARQILWLTPLVFGATLVASAVVALMHQDCFLWVIIAIGTLIVLIGFCQIKRLGKKDRGGCVTNMNKFLLCSVGGLAIGFGIVMLIAAFIPAVRASFDVSLFGLGVAVLSLGVILWDKVFGKSAVK